LRRHQVVIDKELSIDDRRPVFFDHNAVISGTIRVQKRHRDLIRRIRAHGKRPAVGIEFFFFPGDRPTDDEQYIQCDEKQNQYVELFHVYDIQRKIEIHLENSNKDRRQAHVILQDQLLL
jgi:hypothetical protein